MRRLLVAALVLVASLAEARADIVAPPFAPCRQKESGKRCFDKYGRPGRCEHDDGIGCVLDGPATSASASAAATKPKEAASSGADTSSCTASSGKTTRSRVALFLMTSLVAVAAARRRRASARALPDPRLE